MNALYSGFVTASNCASTRPPEQSPDATSRQAAQPILRQFASDNYAAMCPEAWDALQAANHDHLPGYGDDRWTERARALIRDVFETDCDVHFVFNGTAANALALSALCRSHHAVLCHRTAHIETDECAAPEFFSGGARVMALPGEAGKLAPPTIENFVRTGRGDVHSSKPQAVSLTQATESGTVYSVDEVRAIGEVCRNLGLHLHMDGARFANAVASLNVAPRELTWQAGVDVLCFGATKNGAAVSEAVVFFNRELAREFDYKCKQAGQLASKMRFLSAPWVGLLQDGAWLRHAAHANRMAGILEEALRGLPGIEILFPRQANAAFVRLPDAVAEALRERGWKFYDFVAQGGARLMCSWDTTEDDITHFTNDSRAALCNKQD